MKVKIGFFMLSVILSSISAVDETKDIEGECSVTDAVRNITFDLKQLGTEMGYHLYSDDERSGRYRFNLCKKLSKKCNNQTASACYEKGGSAQFVIGFESQLIFNDGQIRFSFTGEKCDDSRNYSLNVLLHCDYSPLKNDFLGVFPHTDECVINIMLRTPAACPFKPDHVKNAVLTVTTPNNKILNFKSLESSNHDVVNASNFHIGFPILYGHNLMCEPGTFVCYVNTSATEDAKKYVNMGTMTSNFKYEKGRAVLSLTSNEICDKNTTFSSEIIFECDNLITGDGSPQFMGTTDCVHKFLWQTSLACGNEKSCQLSTPDGRFYDFSALRGIQYQVMYPNRTDKSIFFSICGPANYPCEGDVGSCIMTETKDQKQTVFAGKFNSTLQIDSSKNAFLKYDNGAPCNANGQRLSTKIEFIVADDKNDETSLLVEDNCDIVIHFKTLLANVNVKNCIAKTANDEEIDLSALINYEGNYVAKVNEKKLPKETSENNVQYLLNVCRPLNSKYSLNCRGNTAACRTVMVGEKHEEELSLGHFEYSMTTEERHEDNTTAVIMKYFKGSQCPNDSDEDILTKVTFFCDETVGLGNPILESIEHCEYAFDFPTNILCKDRRISMKSDGNSSCELVNEKLNVSVDLRPIGIFEDDEKSTKIDICDGSAANRAFTINYRQSMILIQYHKADNQRVEVQLKCGLKNSSMMIVKSDEILVTSESLVVCPLLNIVLKEVTTFDATTTDNKLGDKKADDNTNHGGFSFGYLILAFIIIIAFGAFYLVLRNPERREILSNLIKFRSRSRNVRYTRVDVNEESVLLDGSNRVASESDDEDILA